MELQMLFSNTIRHAWWINSVRMPVTSVCDVWQREYLYAVLIDRAEVWNIALRRRIGDPFHF